MSRRPADVAMTGALYDSLISKGLKANEIDVYINDANGTIARTELDVGNPLDSQFKQVADFAVDGKRPAVTIPARSLPTTSLVDSTITG